MERFLRKKKELPDEYPTNAILGFLDLVLSNNMIIFGNTYLLQIKGTKMGISSAV